MIKMSIAVTIALGLCTIASLIWAHSFGFFSVAFVLWCIVLLLSILDEHAAPTHVKIPGKTVAKEPASSGSETTPTA